MSDSKRFDVVAPFGKVTFVGNFETLRRAEWITTPYHDKYVSAYRYKFTAEDRTKPVGCGEDAEIFKRNKLYKYTPPKDPRTYDEISWEEFEGDEPEEAAPKPKKRATRRRSKK